MNWKTLRPESVQLDRKTLIEASAGTGKTWTIAALYLRLILEQALTVQQILVVTFTNAATRELRDRLRRRLVQAHAAFSSGAAPLDDDFLKELLEQTPDHEQAVRTLLAALRNFDECAVFTTHGFCGRLLREAALESGLPLEQEMVLDDGELKQQIADDFWRRRFRDATEPLRELFRRGRVTPESLLADIESAISKPYLRIERDVGGEDYHQIAGALNEAYERVRDVWRRSADEIMALLTDEGLNKRSYAAGKLPGMRSWMDHYLVPDTPGVIAKANNRLGVCSEAYKFARSSVKPKKGYDPIEHAFFDLWQDFLQAHAHAEAHFEQLLNQIRYDLLCEMRTALAVEKRKTGVMSADDLLLGLQEALHGDSAAPLIEQARRRFPVALIDEFQDTDPVQYDIFSRLYGDEGGRVFYVGDPKQAIYGFRGADVFTYLKAREELAGHGGELLGLDTNWRSAKGVVEAVNDLFTCRDRPFWLPGLQYQRVEASRKDHGEIDSLKRHYGEFRLLALESDKAITSSVAKTRVVDAIASDIARLLTRARDEGWQIGSKAFTGGDIAVLVRGHKQGDAIQQALRERGVGSVKAGNDSVFASPQAEQLAILMAAVAHGNNEAEIRLALATELFGLSAAGLVALDDDIEAWETWLDDFDQWRRLWLDKGFMVMFRAVMHKHGIYRKLLALADGERRLTDLIHLAELLNHEAADQSLGMEGLLRWLNHARERAANESNPSEERKLRLESEENLVTIATVHASKGLEYSVVYCPFVWSVRAFSDKGKPFIFHDPGNDYQPSLEMGSSRRDDWKSAKIEEEFADDLRLLYVALTRARLHCTVVTGHIQGCANSGLSWLLHGNGLTGLPLEEARKQIKERLKEGVLPDDLPDTMRQETLDEDTWSQFEAASAPVTGEPRSFQRKLPDPPRVTSYTGLASGQHGEQPDYDAGVRAVVEGSGILRGPQAGSCLHAILEHMDFTRSPVEQRPLVEETLTQFGFDVSHGGEVLNLLDGVMSTPLLADGAVRLSMLTEGQRLNEMAFYFPVSDLDVKSLQRLLKTHLDDELFRDAAAQLRFNRVSGYLKGYIDLVWRHDGRYYLADYKSNVLAGEAQGYTREVMARAMSAEHYYLQYLIYTVALHRYLSLRLPGYEYEQHFGGVHYLFLRGMTPENGGRTGVYFTRPALALIEELEEWLS